MTGTFRIMSGKEGISSKHGRVWGPAELVVGVQPGQVSGSTG